MSGLYEPTDNRLLAALPSLDLQRLQTHLTLTMVRSGEVLQDAGSPVNHVYFPTNAIVSLVQVTRTGSSSDLAIVGSEGIVGVSSFMGGDTTLSSAIVQCSGYVYRLPGKILKQEFARGGVAQFVLLRYTRVLLTQMAQAAVCNRHHSLEQRLCRWLLLSLDRLPSNQLQMTQEWIAGMLGVRREGVTEAAGKLQSAGIIEYRRGRISVLNRIALEKRACECYSVVKLECDRLLPRTARSTSPITRPIAAPFKDKEKIPCIPVARTFGSFAPALKASTVTAEP